MQYHRTACPNDISKACLQTAYWEIQLKEKREEKETLTDKLQEWKKEQRVKRHRVEESEHRRKIRSNEMYTVKHRQNEFNSIRNKQFKENTQKNTGVGR